jgi:predicted component of viral defense system (DUF524 family)
MKELLEHEFLLTDKTPILFNLWVESDDDDGIVLLDPESALYHGENAVQIKEGFSYEYKLPTSYSLGDHQLVKSTKSNPNVGRIIPNVYVGSLILDVLKESNKCGVLRLEVRSTKTSYREDYRTMLEDITEKCNDLILSHSSPIAQNLQVDFSQDPKTLYQRFTFIKSILDSDEFNESIHKIVFSPVTKWYSKDIERDLRGIRKIDSRAIRQFSSASNRLNLPDKHTLKDFLPTVPTRITSICKTESVDTIENQFIKYALQTFLELITSIRQLGKSNQRLYLEAGVLENQLDSYLSHSMFKGISRLNSIPHNSPVLQRKEGYREIFKTWLMFDLAAKLIWRGGDDVYAAGKKDVATLYEYWIFFKLLDTIKKVFTVEPKELNQLVKTTAEGLNLQLMQGKHIAIKGVYGNATRNLNLEFSFNRPFSGNKHYPTGGSWTKPMRPDYTLSIWPEALSQDEAEQEELIVHIHFDAKYKLDSLSDIIDETYAVADEDKLQSLLDKEKKEQSKETFKRIDLLKMHAYKDAIRRTGGAYVLYPGNSNMSYIKIGFHEILPGLGAFAVRPDKTNDGTQDLEAFLTVVVNHFQNRASQREKSAFRTFDIHRYKPNVSVNTQFPENYGVNRSLLPEETYVLVGYYREDQLEWVEKNKLYNVRTGSIKGSLNLSAKEIGAKYLLLHGRNEQISGRLIKLKNSGPKLFSRKDLFNKSYPNPSSDFYLVYEIDENIEMEFANKLWDLTKLNGYQQGRSSSLPFSTDLAELMAVLVE